MEPPRFEPLDGKGDDRQQQTGRHEDHHQLTDAVQFDLRDAGTRETRVSSYLDFFALQERDEE